MVVFGLKELKENDVCLACMRGDMGKLESLMKSGVDVLKQFQVCFFSSN